MEDNKEYDSKILDSMDDIYERENELLNKSNGDCKNNEQNEEKNKNNITKYYANFKLSVMKYRNMMLILLIYIIISFKQSDNFISNFLSKLKLSDNINSFLTNLLKGLIFILILYLLGIKVIY